MNTEPTSQDGERTQTATEISIAENLAQRRAKLEELLALQEPMARILAQVPVDMGIEAISARNPDNVIQFSSLTREKAMALLRALRGGKWEKRVCHENGAKVDYQTEIEGVRVLLYYTEPPASCQIVEEVLEIPASRQTVRRLVCA